MFLINENKCILLYDKFFRRKNVLCNLILLQVFVKKFKFKFKLYVWLNNSQ